MLFMQMKIIENYPNKEGAEKNKNKNTGEKNV